MDRQWTPHSLIYFLCKQVTQQVWLDLVGGLEGQTQTDGGDDNITDTLKMG